jgi:hypothetical protein
MTIALVLTGCGDATKEKVHPVKGQLFYKGMPTPGAVIWLHRIEPKDAPAQKKLQTPPRGVVQGDGTFEISTYATNDGAPAGTYRVSVRWTKVKGGDEEENLLPVRYLDPGTSGLPVVEIKAEPNVLAKIDLIP